MTLARVSLWGRTIGAVALQEGERFAAFEYDPDFVESRIEVSPIAMPLSNRIYVFPDLPARTFHGLPGLLADSIPDRFGSALVDALVELASDILGRRGTLAGSFANAHSKATLTEILRVGASAGGARAKAAIAWNPATGEVRSGQMPAGEGFGDWLLKFDGVTGNEDTDLDTPRVPPPVGARTAPTG